ncbi:ABC exporter membrane fusion protein [Candidatus Gracilibacteria bacterium]|nr:ABC exporter membrane fusion protein [Candidatus Gracilibacteria bacterium]NJM86292.1 ABC exporter membrane fusion protein [Hydrococcus sp. RU_2_2]
MNLEKLPKSFNRSLLTWIITGGAIAGGIVYYGISQTNQVQKTPEPIQKASLPRQIVALGRLEPEKEVIRVSVPAALSNDRIAQLLIERGQRVKTGQVIAILDSRDRLQDALLEAQKDVKVAQTKLAQVKAGAKSGEIAAQKAEIANLQAQLQGDMATQQATITRWQSEVNNAQADYNRYQSLHQEGAISSSEFDRRQLALQTAQAQLNEAQANKERTEDTLQKQIQSAKATLSQIAEVRPVDVEAAQAEVDKAIATVRRAESELKQASVRSPMAGRILEIYAKPGEVVGNNGIANLGQTDQMQVVAEVYQSDIDLVRVGQQVTVTGESFAPELRGTVRQIGLEVTQQEVFSNQPGENLDQRVIKVRIRIDPKDSQRVAGLTNLQVKVAIQPFTSKDDRRFASFTN